MSPVTLQVKRYRTKLGLTQAELARRAGVTVITVSNLERKPTRDRIDLVMVQRIATALEIPLTELVGEAPPAKRRR